MEPTITVKLMNEYAVDLPLWSDTGLVAPGELPISRPLDRRLRRWAARFQDHFDAATGWDLPDAEVGAHAREGLALADALTRELGPRFRVVLHLWETSAPGDDR